MFVALLLIPVINTNAVNKVDYSLSCQNCDTDRLFTVDVLVNGNADIAAVTLHITFDQNYMEFRSVSGANSAFEIAHAEADGKISAIILCSYGYKFSGKAKLLTYKFKSLKSGSTNINLSVQDPVNSKCKSVPIGNVSSTTLTINSKGVKSTSNKSAVSNSTKTTTSKKSSTDPEPVTAETEEEDSFDLIDKKAESITPYFLAGIGGAAVVFIFIVIYSAGKHSGKKHDKDED